MITGLAHQRSERSVLSDPLLAIARSVVRQCKKDSRHANGTFGFCRHTSQNSKNQKSHFFANAPTEINKFDN
jgi:hypothetical protein